MSQPTPNPKVDLSTEVLKGLELGDYEDISLANKGEIPAPKANGYISVRVYTGFKSPNGNKHFIIREIETGDPIAARRAIEDDLIPELKVYWGERAKKVGHTGPKPKTNPTVPPGSQSSLEDRLLAMFAEWEEHELHSKKDLSGYKTGMRAFIRGSEKRAKIPGYVFDERDIPKIVAKMIVNCDKNTGGPAKLMSNARFVLKADPFFPKKLIKLLKAPKPNGQIKRAKKAEYPFWRLERQSAWVNLSKTDLTTRGLILVAANSSQHAIDVANLTVRELIAACEAVAMPDRWKTEVAYRMIAWVETDEWRKEMKFTADDVVAFKEVVFTKRELKSGKNLKDILEKQTPEQAQARREAAAGRAAKKVKKYLEKVCKITRKGTSMHSFRHTNVSEWEGQGFPRIACMTLSGHLTEENYKEYAKPLMDHIKQISSHTHGFWRNAGQETVHILTKNQLFEAITTVVRAGNEKVIAEVKQDHQIQNEMITAILKDTRAHGPVLAQILEWMNEINKGFKQLFEWTQHFSCPACGASGRFPITSGHTHHEHN